MGAPVFGGRASIVEPAVGLIALFAYLPLGRSPMADRTDCAHIWFLQPIKSTSP